MSHTNAWDETAPLDSEKAGKGAEEIRKVKTDIKERLALNHNMGGELDPSKSDCEGTHKIITLKAQPAPTSVPAGAGILQMTEKDGIPELCKYSGNPVVETQITKDGIINIEDINWIEYFLTKNSSTLNGKQFLSVAGSMTAQAISFTITKKCIICMSMIGTGNSLSITKTSKIDGVFSITGIGSCSTADSHSLTTFEMARQRYFVINPGTYNGTITSERASTMAGSSINQMKGRIDVVASLTTGVPVIT